MLLVAQLALCICVCFCEDRISNLEKTEKNNTCHWKWTHSEKNTCEHLYKDTAGVSLPLPTLPGLPSGKGATEKRKLNYFLDLAHVHLWCIVLNFVFFRTAAAHNLTYFLSLPAKPAFRIWLLCTASGEVRGMIVLKVFGGSGTVGSVG